MAHSGYHIIALDYNDGIDVGKFVPKDPQKLRGKTTVGDKPAIYSVPFTGRTLGAKIGARYEGKFEVQI